MLHSDKGNPESKDITEVIQMAVGESGEALSG
jgi:hypothetical protein